ncbi:1515_t:CDS:10 [Scutellospora calospora]|uniref:1515_t:CDS:1 n=1 Tax=Scutellospora calospora TaxID=85575 RepID=A0ACA9JVM3_9GLOM|nr:1515_t:CDS:10 [Scutellospora calospora]
MTSVRSNGNSSNLDVATLTSFGYRPFEEDNENVISKLFQRVKSSFVVSPGTSNVNTSTEPLEISSAKPSQDPDFEPSRSTSSLLLPDKENKGFKHSVTPAPPVVSIEPLLGNVSPNILVESAEGIQEYVNGTVNGSNTSLSLVNGVSNPQNSQEGFEPGNQNSYPIYKDISDTRSIRSVQTIASTGNNSGYSFSKVIRRLRGEGVNKGYWMADDSCKECYECKVTFTIVRRKHHCRICGQIFCSKCASNIIPGEKFNYDGAMRVCNFCRQLMKEYGEDSDPEADYWTEKNDSSNNALPRIHYTPPMLTDSPNISSNTTSELSPSTINSHLSPRPPSPDTLSLNDGLRRIISAGSSLFMSRSRSNTITEDLHIVGLPSSPAPFRRSLTEDDKNTPAANPEAVLDPEIAPFMSDDEGDDDVHYDSLTNPSNVFSFVTSILHVGGNTDSATPTPAVSEYADSDDESSEFGSRSSLKAMQKGQRADDIRSHFARDKGSPSRRRSINNNNRPSRMSRRSGLLRQINPNNIPMEMSCSLESRPSSPFSMRHSRTISTQTKTEISPISLQHMRKLLRQFLRESEIDLSEGWENVIMGLMTKVSDNLNPNVRGGDEIDIRHYVKIKRIPGGTPQDSEYVHGVVCAKNLAHKQMPRTLHNPRVLILTFALEYHRVENQLMSLDPVIAQEEEHLRLLVNRIAALRPHLVLVEKTVARKALQMLLEKHIAVALNVKSSVIEAVARCARADIIQSIDKLVSEPKLGNCGTFMVKTFDHKLIPGRRKTYLFFESCPKDLGCTIVLRGGNIETLEKIKRITDLMVFVVYNLKLETALIIDQFAKIPATIDEKIDSNEHISNSISRPDDVPDPLAPYESTILSVSPFIKFPPPYLLTKTKQAEKRLTDLINKRNATTNKDNDKQHSTSTSVGLSGILRTPEQVIAEAELADAIHDHIFQMRAWESFIYNNIVSPYAHQNITVLSFKVCTVNGTSCSEPEILVMEYYRDSDRTLGQYLEEMCSRSAYLCSTCDRPLLMHYHSFCHGNSRITVYIEEQDIPQLNVDKIFMSTHCKICNAETAPTLMTEDTWKYSFGKYLELSFYQTELWSRMEKCSHNVFRDHDLYFHLNKLTVRFRYESIELLEVYAPPMHLYTKPEVQIRLKNQDLDTIRHKITDYWDSVTDRIKNFNYDIVQPDKVEMCKQELLEMSRRVVTEKKFMLQKLQQTYVNSPPEDTLALNNVLYVLQDKVVAWEKDFNDIARQYFPRLTAKQIRRLFVDNHEAITLGRGYSGTFLNDLPLINMDLDATIDPSRHEDYIGPTIVPKLGSSPTADLILNGLKELDFFHEGEIESLENDIEKVASQLTLFPFMDPKVSRRLSMKWMQESKLGQRQLISRTASDSIFPMILDKQEESESLTESDFSQPTEIPRIIPSTIKQKHTASSPLLFTSLDSHENRRNLLERDKEINVQEHPSLKRVQAHLKKSQSTASEKSGIPRQNSKSSRSTSFKHTPSDGFGLSPIRTHEHKKSKLAGYYKPKRIRPTILPSKPTIEVFNNVKAATAEESEEEDFDEGVDDDNDQFCDDETRVFSLNRTDAFDESLGIEEFIPLPARESSSDESYIYNPTLTFLGKDFNEPTTPVSESFSGPDINSQTPFTGRFLLPNDTNDSQNGTRKVMPPLMRSLASFWTDKKNLDPLIYPLNPTEHVFPDSPIIVREDEPGSIIAFALSSKEYLEKLKSVQQTNLNNDIFMSGDDRFSSKSSNLILDGDEGMDVEDNLLSHMKYQFSGDSTQFFCKIFCADQFDALRRKCNCDSTYIQSLARCVKWDSSGGKSGSAFLKTRDDRLVMKQISRNEVDAFLKFAPKYFEYIANALVHLPTVLTKIFGFYRIGYKNDQTGKQMKIDLIVMENLFYERKVSKIFDLKGSMRNRHVQSTGKENEVLLDENLLELIMNDNPLYLREHSKKLLYESLHNDTIFLSRHNVMDYSLLVGFDEEKHELVVGILDFIRTFTWDKKLESWVKESGFLGGGGKEPTIVTPKQYKNRFREAMDRYFLMVPDRWIAYKSYRKAGPIL